MAQQAATRWPPARLPHLWLPPLYCRRRRSTLALGNGDGECEPILPLAPRRRGYSCTAARWDLAGGGAAPAPLDLGSAITPLTGQRQFLVVSSAARHHRIRRHPLPAISIVAGDRDIRHFHPQVQEDAAPGERGTGEAQGFL
ncbi:unnamed protein product [Urochloa humidicola]